MGAGPRVLWLIWWCSGCVRDGKMLCLVHHAEMQATQRGATLLDCTCLLEHLCVNVMGKKWWRTAAHGAGPCIASPFRVMQRQHTTLGELPGSRTLYVAQRQSDSGETVRIVKTSGHQLMHGPHIKSQRHGEGNPVFQHSVHAPAVVHSPAAVFESTLIGLFHGSGGRYSLPEISPRFAGAAARCLNISLTPFSSFSASISVRGGAVKKLTGISFAGCFRWLAAAASTPSSASWAAWRF